VQQLLSAVCSPERGQMVW